MIVFTFMDNELQQLHIVSDNNSVNFGIPYDGMYTVLVD